MVIAWSCWQHFYFISSLSVRSKSYDTQTHGWAFYVRSSTCFWLLCDFAVAVLLLLRLWSLQSLSLTIYILSLCGTVHSGISPSVLSSDGCHLDDFSMVYGTIWCSSSCQKVSCASCTLRWSWLYQDLWESDWSLYWFRPRSLLHQY